MQEHTLTRLSPAGGCAAKIEPAILQQIIENLKVDSSDELLNIHRREDVGMTSLPLTTVQLVQSVDTITPVSDDPTTFGAIAAAHALSDLYAKGATPLSGLLTLGLPIMLVTPQTAVAILQGAIDKLHEAGAKFLGGHTIASSELHLGLAVTGILTTDMIPNTTCQQDDLLVLTKPLGTGIAVTALKFQNAGITLDAFSPEIVQTAEQQMLQLNQPSSEAIRLVTVNACTDVTGFGLLGHLHEMLSPTGLSACIYLKEVPHIPGVVELAAQDILSTGGERNAAFFWQSCAFTDDITYAEKMLLFDPQTSGGLLISVSPRNIDLLMKELQQRGVKASIIGQVTHRTTRIIKVIR